MIVLSVLVAGLLAAGYIMRTPKVYAAYTIVQVDQARRKVVNIEEISREDFSSLELMKTIERNMVSTALFKRLSEKLPPEKLGLPPSVRPYSENELIENLRSRVSVRLIRGTRLITVTAEHQEPTIARDISQMLVNEYLRSSVEQRVAVSRDANRFL